MMVLGFRRALLKEVLQVGTHAFVLERFLHFLFKERQRRIKDIHGAHESFFVHLQGDLQAWIQI